MDLKDSSEVKSHEGKDARVTQNAQTGAFETKYDHSYCDQAIRLSTTKLHLEDLAKEWKVCRKTIYNWRKNHPEFDEAIRKFGEYSTAEFLEIGRYALFLRDFKENTFRLILERKTNCWLNSPVDLPLLKEAISFTDKCNVVINALGEGEINPAQAQTLINIISAAAKVEEVTELKDKLAKIEERMEIK